jgi:GT2 family glycosyltransferase
MVDAEWCHRIHQKKFVIRFTPTVQVVHLGGASSKDIQGTLMRDNFKGLTHFCRKHYPESVRLVVEIVRVGLTMRSILYTVLGNRALGTTYKTIAQEIQA